MKNFGGGIDPKVVRGNANEDGTEYIPFPKDRISIDEEKLVVELKILPNENVRLYYVNDRLDDDYEEDFNLKTLRIASAHGSTEFEGRHVFKNFRPIKQSWYSFGPEIIGFVYEYR